MLRTSMAQLVSSWLFAFLLFISFRAHVGVADDRILKGQSLSGDQTIISNGGKFELGFFTRGNSLKYYIGIWYKLPKQTVVWVANREHPVSSPSSSELRLADDGNLVLLADSKNPVWSSNSSNLLASDSTIAVLLDNGNLILQDNLSSNILWQSFDHPTNTYLPGANLGYDKLTGVNRFLTSWRNPEDPSPGRFTFEIDPNGVIQFYLVKDRRHRYWTTGVWTGEVLPAVQEMRSGYFNFSYVSNKSVNEFAYSVRDTSSIHDFMLDFTGEMKRLRWNNDTGDWLQFAALPWNPCDVEGRCGRFSSCNNFSSPYCQCLQGFKPKSSKNWNLGDHTGGCIRKTQLQCGEKDGFLDLSNTQLPANPINSSVISSAEECRSACSRNCSCTAYAYRSRCLIWYGDLYDLKSLSDIGSSDEAGLGDIYIRLEASELADHGVKNKRKTMAIVLIAVSGVSVIIIVVLLLGFRYCKRTNVKTSEVVQGPLVTFDYRVLRKATRDFSEKLGSGSFGTVFKGELPDSGAVAVKKLESMRQGEKQFRMEVSTIGMIQHLNLVRLHGFCCEGAERLLVYDYMAMGSLDSILFAEGSEVVLDWKQRYQIALGIARGLSYLHEKCRECIMHCDIKPENILLDMDMCPKIADFGMAKLLGHEFSRVLTTVRGTIGYLAPEWLAGSPITPKADVYSFGLLLFEIVSGRRNTDRCEKWNRLYFPLWAAIKLHEGDTLCLLDPKFKGEADEEELARVCKVACWCIQDKECSRPTMGEVVQLFEAVLDVGLPPIPGLLQKLSVDDALADNKYHSTI